MCLLAEGCADVHAAAGLAFSASQKEGIFPSLFQISQALQMGMDVALK